MREDILIFLFEIIIVPEMGLFLLPRIVEEAR